MINKKFLITTGLEESFPEEDHSEVVFLGEWCRDFTTKDAWEKLNYKILPYHWDDRDKLYADYKEFKRIYEALLEELSIKLNEIHQEDLSLKSWRIILGPWLADFIQAIFDRYETLLVAFNENQDYALRAVARDRLSNVPNDMVHFHSLFASDDWNESIYTQLITMHWPSQVKIFWITKKSRASESLRANVIGGFFRQWLLPKISGLVSGKDDVFFIESYLPKKTEMRLQMRLGQVPNLWKSQDVPKVKADIRQRQWSLSSTTGGDLENIVRKMIPDNIPTAYLEGFVSLNNKVSGLSWTKNPSSIFTSNSYSGDDLFKVWVARKIKQKSRLIIGQHGGHIGTDLFSFHEEHQIEIATTYLSWGWSDASRKKIIPVGNIRCFGSAVAHSPSGGALMVELSSPRYAYHMMAMPIAGQLLQYFEEQKLFLKSLPSEVRNQVILRLGKRDWGWRWTERWNEAMPEVKLDDGTRDIRSLIEGSRLYISTYNATTFLETMSWNIPTIMFWNKSHWELNAQSEPYFELIEKAGIFHSTPQSAARKMLQIWDDVDSWWYSNEIQKVREIFVNQYAKVPNDTIKVMKEILTKSN